MATKNTPAQGSAGGWKDWGVSMTSGLVGTGFWGHWLCVVLLTLSQGQSPALG